MRILKGTLLLLCSFGCMLPALAQQDAHFSHYMFNPTFYNPAWTGLENTGYVTALHRTQWAGYSSSFDGSDGNPTTQLVTLALPTQRYVDGVGFYFVNDQLGALRNIEAKFNLAWNKNFGRSKLSIGIQPGILSQTIDFSKFRFANPDDPLNIDGKESQIGFDLGAGITFLAPKYFVGVGVKHLIQPSFDFGLAEELNTDFQNEFVMNANLYGGYNYQLNLNLMITPNVMVRTDFETVAFDLGVIATYQEKMWGGLSYRQQEAVTVLLGYSFLRDRSLKAGYAVDIVIDERDAKQATSHEIFLRYNFNFGAGGPGGPKKIIRTPRFRHPDSIINR